MLGQKIFRSIRRTKIEFALLSGRHNTSGINLEGRQLCAINVVNVFYDRVSDAIVQALNPQNPPSEF